MQSQAPNPNYQKVKTIWRLINWGQPVVVLVVFFILITSKLEMNSTMRIILSFGPGYGLLIQFVNYYVWSNWKKIPAEGFYRIPQSGINSNDLEKTYLVFSLFVFGLFEALALLSDFSSNITFIIYFAVILLSLVSETLIISRGVGISFGNAFWRLMSKNTIFKDMIHDLEINRQTIGPSKSTEQ